LGAGVAPHPDLLPDAAAVVGVVFVADCVQQGRLDAVLLLDVLSPHG
jgi:hypothetical protein